MITKRWSSQYSKRENNFRRTNIRMNNLNSRRLLRKSKSRPKETIRRLRALARTSQQTRKKKAKKKMFNKTRRLMRS
jgi:hypothetical protein